MGAFKKTPLNEVTRNDAWEGVKMAQVDSLESYMYFRPVQQKDKQSMRDRKADIFVPDFLDSLAQGLPQGAWSVMRDTTQRFGILRSRIWPGFIAYHRGNSQVYGSFYLGNGIKNTDLAFMI